MKSKQKPFSRILSIIPKLFLFAWCAFTVYAIFWMIIGSFKTNYEFFSDFWGFFETPQWGNYQQAWTKYQLGKYFLNSLFVVMISVAGILVLSTPAAYVLSRFRFRGQKLLNSLYILGMGIPLMLLLVPLYSMIVKLNLNDTHAGLIIVYIATSIPFTVYLLQSFMRSLPHEMEEAAYIDGASPFRAFFDVMLPMCSPGIVTCAIFNFVWLWNEFLLAFIFITKQSKYTLSIGLYGLIQSLQLTGNWVVQMAGVVIVIVPTMVVYVLLSRRIIEGMTMGAVKE